MSMDNSRPAKRMMSTISKYSEEAEDDEIRSGNLCEINEFGGNVERVKMRMRVGERERRREKGRVREKGDGKARMSKR